MVSPKFISIHFTMRLFISFWVYLLFVSAQCQNKDNQQLLPKRELIKGLTLVAPPKPFNGNPFDTIKSMNSSWIAVVPYAFCRIGEPIVHFDHHNNDKRWWGESRAGIEETIRRAKSNGIKVMLKPQIWVGREWIGNLTFQTVEDWEKWEKSYEDYILPFAAMADSMGVEMLCIGTELKASIRSRPAYWPKLIAKIRNIYQGKLTYASNWDEYEMVKFWNKLDYIGVDAYFPLSEDPNPDIKKLMKAWDPVLAKLEKTSKMYKRPILFTEYGYLSVDGSGGKTWELEANLSSKNYNPQAQATCLNALLECCSKHHFWHGGFLWKWYDNPSQMKRGLEKDHSPQGKLAEGVVRKWYAVL